jgi:hypothetical protein
MPVMQHSEEQEHRKAQVDVNIAEADMHYGETEPFGMYAAVRRRLAEIDPRLLPHPQQIGSFEGYAAVGAALLAAVGSHVLVESVYKGGRIERSCHSCLGKPDYPCPEFQAIAEALGIEVE